MGSHMWSLDCIQKQRMVTKRDEGIGVSSEASLRSLVRSLPVAPGEEHWLLDTSLDEVLSQEPCAFPALPVSPDLSHSEFAYSWS